MRELLERFMGQVRARVGRIPWGDPKLARENREIAC
jgi:hypothetical protein